MASLEPGLGIGLLAVSGIAGIRVLFEFELVSGLNACLAESFGIGAHVGVAGLPVHSEVAEVPVTLMLPAAVRSDSVAGAKRDEVRRIGTHPLVFFCLTEMPGPYVVDRDRPRAATRRARRMRLPVGVPRLGPSVSPRRGCAVGQGVSTRLVLPRLAIGFRLSLVDGKGRCR